MSGFVPDDIVALIEAIEAKQGIEFQERKRRKEVESARLAARLVAIDRLREEKRDELRAACLTIEQWVERFDASVGGDVWRLIGQKSRIMLYVGRYWLGEPIPESVITECAILHVTHPYARPFGRFVYDECHKGRASRSDSIPFASMLAERLHPGFVLECAAHLSGPDAWKYVRTELERLNGK